MQRSAGRHGSSCCRGGNGGSFENSSPFQRQKGLKGLGDGGHTEIRLRAQTPPTRGPAPTA